jgi:hypothetical protein
MAASVSMYKTGDLVLFQDPMCVIQGKNDTPFGYSTYSIRNVETGRCFEVQKHFNSSRYDKPRVD